MSSDEIARLYAYMERRFDAIDAKLERKADKKPVHETLDYILKKLETEEQERLAMSSKLDRLETGFETMREEMHQGFAHVYSVLAGR